MAEYIHKGDLLEHLMYVNNDLPLITTEEWDIAKGFDKAVEEVKNYPTDDVQPVKHGKWVFNKPPDDWIMSLYTCDQCSHVEDGKPNYCPNCGARMDGET